jgi:glycosyltransferase involved in cell wall biosynthesis
MDQQVRERLSQYDVVITATQAQKEAVDTFREKKTVQIPKPVTRMPRVRDAHKDAILWVASCKTVKQPWLFCELASNFPHESFIMIMPPSDGTLMTSICQRVGLMQNLELIAEQVSYDNLAQYFASAKLFVNTSLTESWPNTFLEAGYAGVPLLSYLVNSDGTIDRHAIGICAEGSMHAMIEALATLLEDTTLLAEYGENHRKLVDEYHTVDKVMEQWRAILSKVISSK